MSGEEMGVEEARITDKDRLSGHVIVCSEHSCAHLTLASDFEEQFAKIESRIRASERAAVLAEVEEETVALVAALGGAIEQIKAHGGEPSHNAIAIRDQVIARIRNGGKA